MKFMQGATLIFLGFLLAVLLGIAIYRLELVDTHLAAIERSTARLVVVQEATLAHLRRGEIRVQQNWQIPPDLEEIGLRTR
jgi:hypothetical protein